MRLLVFAREPVPGRVKTRLVPPLTPAQAADVYAALLRGTVVAACAARDAGAVEDVVLFAADPAPSPTLESIAAGHALSIERQRGADLGERMRNALFDSLVRGSPALLVGTDCPELDAGIIAQAASALSRHDSVFVPARDGGYVLVGLSRAIDVFTGVPWSSPQTMAQTRRRVARLHASFAELEALSDLDTAEDVERWLGGQHRELHLADSTR